MDGGFATIEDKKIPNRETPLTPPGSLSARNLAITESKKIVSGEGEDTQVSFEKHKIFLYKEDFDKFMDGLQQAIQFIETEGKGNLPLSEEENTEEIKIDIDF